jgi:hypothetical protein
MKRKFKLNSQGFGHVEGFLVFIVIFVITGVGYFVYSHASGTPSTPTGLTAVGGGGKITLDWNNNPESDIAYYAVRRSSNPTSDKSTWTRLAGNFTTSSAVDSSSTLVGTTRYYYYVTAVSTTNQLSGRSSVASATPNGSSTTPPPTTPPPTTPPPTTPPPTTPPPSGGGTVIWGGGFEDVASGVGTPSNLGPFKAYYKNIAHDYDSKVFCTIETTTTRVRTGSKSMKLTIGAPLTDSGGSDDPGRCLPTANTANLKQGSDIWFGTSIYFENLDLSQVGSSRQYFFDSFGWRYTNTGLNGPGGNLMTNSSKHWNSGFNLSGTVGDFAAGNRDLGPVTSNKWEDYVYHIKFSAGTDGIFETWHDGTKVGSTYHGKTLKSSGYTVEHRDGIYEGVNVSKTRVMYIDNTRIGSSYSAVDPSR